MRLGMRRLGVPMCVALLLSIGGIESAYAADQGAFVGTIVSYETYAPIAGACVDLVENGAGQAVLATDCADSAGRYWLPAPAGAYYKLRFYAAGYEEQWGWGRNSWLNADALFLVSGSTSVNAKLSKHAGSITGRITDDNGDPLSDTIVVATRLNDVNGWNIARTAADGSYAIHNLWEGDYRVYYYSFESLAKGRERQWYPRSRTVEGAQTVRVNPLAATRIDDRFLPTVSLSVTAIDTATGKPLTGGFCAYVYINMGRSVDGIQSCGGWDGTVVFPEVPVGLHAVRVVPPSVAPNYPVQAKTWVDIKPGGSQISMDISRMGAVSGDVVDPQGKPVPACMTFVRPEWHGMVTNAYGSRSCATDGRFGYVPQAPGPVQLWVEPTDGVHGAQWVTIGGAGTGDQRKALRVEIGSNGHATLGKITVGLAASVTGTVRTDTGQPLKDICVYPFAVAADHTSPHCSGADGKYTVTGLGPFVWPLEYVDWSGQHAWRWSGGASNRFGATAITLAAGAVGRSDVALERTSMATALFAGDDGISMNGEIVAIDATTGDTVGADGDLKGSSVYPAEYSGSWGSLAWITGVARQQIVFEYRNDEMTCLSHSHVSLRGRSQMTVTKIAIPAPGVGVSQARFAYELGCPTALPNPVPRRR